MITEYFETMQAFEAATNDTEAGALLERASNIAEGYIDSPAPLADRLRVAVKHCESLCHETTLTVLKRLTK